MSWNDFHRRRDVIETALRQVRHDPEGALSISLTFDQVPHADEVFTGPDELMLALQYKWTQLLTGRIGLALSAAEISSDVDRVDAVASAWRRTAEANPVLRELLDAETGAGLTVALARERRLLALSAGLAELTEPADLVEQIGAAFMMLVRGNAPHVAERAGGRKVRTHGLARVLG